MSIQFMSELNLNFTKNFEFKAKFEYISMSLIIDLMTLDTINSRVKE